MPITRWIVVGNDSYAQIFEIQGLGKQFKEILILDNPNGRKKNGDFVSDRPGRAFDSMGSSRHAVEKKISPHTHEVQGFARKISETLQKAKSENQFEELIFVLPPEFLGELNQILPQTLKKIVIKEIKKDLPQHLSRQDLLQHLTKYLEQ